MNTISVNKDEAITDFPIVENWLENIKNFLKKDVDNSKLELFYTFGFFLPKVKNKEEFYIQMYQDCSEMKYDERLNFELSKVRVSLTIKNGNFMFSDRLPKGKIPTSIKDLVSEITKVKMIIESEFHNNKDIIKSIPQLNTEIISFDLIKEYVNDDIKKSDLDLDSILDKISNHGLESLSDEEKEFLDKKSKDL